jgi:hypothetical protein
VVQFFASTPTPIDAGDVAYDGLWSNGQDLACWSPGSIMKGRSTLDHPADYAEHAIRNLERAEKLTGEEGDAKLKEAEIWARLAQAAAVLRAAQIQSGKN